MKKLFFRRLIVLLIFTVAIFSLNHVYLKQEIFETHSILFGSLNFVFSALLLWMVYTRITANKSAIKPYLYASSFKLVALAGALIPYIIPKTDSSKFYVIQFFIFFFPLLLVETIGVVTLINHPLDEKTK
ncbi:MAG: hypothetical protein MK078_04405 [Crocinitomicaceae bacterium]|nr:hypothetical protein [Crocinitomicaceae bacterium]